MNALAPAYPASDEPSAADPVSPELALVCPELRARALALLADPPYLRVAAPAAPAPRTDPLAPLPLRLAVYAATRAATTAVECAALAAVVFALALALTALS